VFLLALVVVPSALAGHPSGPYFTRSANLDGDRAAESAVGSLDVDSGHSYSRWSVTIEDRCGRMKRYPVSAVWNGTLETLRVPEANGLVGRREVLYVLRAGPAKGEVAVVQLAARSPCPVPRFLFHYLAPKDVQLMGFSAELRDLDPSAKGLELRLEERFATARRARLYRYDRRAARYVLYRTTTA